MPTLDALHWDLYLRGAVCAWLLLHVALLAAPAPRAAARLAIGVWLVSVIAYLFCQQMHVLLALPRGLMLPVVALCVSSAGWMWVAARAAFDDRFAFTWPVLVPIGVLLAVGLAGNLPYLPDGAGPLRDHAPDSAVGWLNRLHTVAILAFTAAALWEVARGWRDDLVSSRRAARRWVAMGIAAYAAVALVIEVALRGQAVGPLLPALHVAGIGLLAFALAVVVARHSVAAILGFPDAGPHATAELRAGPAAAVTAAAPPAEASAPAPPHPMLARLEQAMTLERAYRREGLTVAALAETLGVGEAALRALINQQLGYRNFNDFLHHHRLQEAMPRLASEDLPILTIALECGYGSIGPFNRAFKQRTGLTPSEYRGAMRLQKS